MPARTSSRWATLTAPRLCGQQRVERRNYDGIQQENEEGIGEGRDNNGVKVKMEQWYYAPAYAADITNEKIGGEGATLAADGTVLKADGTATGFKMDSRIVVDAAGKPLARRWMPLARCMLPTAASPTSRWTLSARCLLRTVHKPVPS